MKTTQMADETRSQVNAKQVLHLLLEQQLPDMPEVAQPLITEELIDSVLRVGYLTQFDKHRTEVQRQVREIVVAAMRTNGSVS
jgi:hypothetical protein